MTRCATEVSIAQPDSVARFHQARSRVCGCGCVVVVIAGLKELLEPATLQLSQFNYDRMYASPISSTEIQYRTLRSAALFCS